MNIPLNIDWQQILLHFFNFSILVGGLYLLLFKPVKSFMAKREKHYADMESAAVAREKDTEELKAEMAKREAAFDTELEEKRAAAAKEGIRGMSRVAATEWGKDGINVNVVCPLAWTAKLEQFRDTYPDAFKANVKMPPMGHYGNAETEIGRVCVQLAMPDFKYMSGETLTLEGGMGQRP